MTRALRNSYGYSLMEMLTVIAIIGVLASLIFPAISSARRRARETQCMNNMYQIHVALHQFKQDQRGRFPDFLVGPVEYRGGSPVAAHESSGLIDLPDGSTRLVALYPEYIDTIGVFSCPYSSVNGLGRTFTFHDVIADPMHTILASRPNTDCLRKSTQFQLYMFSSYDFQIPLNRPNDPQVHYSPVWYGQTDANTTETQLARQLRWRRPAADTVVTWCSYHRQADGNGVPTQGSRDFVLFLDGHVSRVGSSNIDPTASPGVYINNAWRTPRN